MPHARPPTAPEGSSCPARPASARPASRRKPSQPIGRAARADTGSSAPQRRSVPLGAFADIATDFGPDPLRRVREVIDGLIGDTGNGEVILGVDDAHLLDDLSAFAVHQLVTR